MQPKAAKSPRRRVLVEVSPSWSERFRLWFNRLRHPRDLWFSEFVAAKKPLSGGRSRPHS